VQTGTLYDNNEPRHCDKMLFRETQHFRRGPCRVTRPALLSAHHRHSPQSLNSVACTGQLRIHNIRRYIGHTSTAATDSLGIRYLQRKLNNGSGRWGCSVIPDHQRLSARWRELFLGVVGQSMVGATTTTTRTLTRNRDRNVRQRPGFLVDSVWTGHRDRPTAGVWVVNSTDAS